MYGVGLSNNRPTLENVGRELGACRPALLSDRHAVLLLRHRLVLCNTAL